VKQASNGLVIDGGCGSFKPIKRNETVVISRMRIGAVREKNLAA
jgi:hypothetical protein